MKVENKPIRPIGILGGTSWPSTIDYYRNLNELAQTTFGGNHSADLILRSVDYDQIKSLYHGGWDRIPTLLAEKIRELASYNPSCIVIANNTLHRAYDVIEAELGLEIPVIHIVDAVGTEATRSGIKSALLLAIKFTMEDGFYAKRLERFGLQVEIPDESDRDRIQEIQTKLARGEKPEAFVAYFRQLIDRFTHLNAVILACTELSMVVDSKQSALKVIDSLKVQCEQAFEVYQRQVE
jgi:aspartate racemase